MRRYRCVDARKPDGFAVTAACAAMRVSRSAYYDWVARGRRDAEAPDDAEVETVRAIRAVTPPTPTTARRG